MMMLASGGQPGDGVLALVVVVVGVVLVVMMGGPCGDTKEVVVVGRNGVAEIRRKLGGLDRR